MSGEDALRVHGDKFRVEHGLDLFLFRGVVVAEHEYPPARGMRVQVNVAVQGPLHI